VRPDSDDPGVRHDWFNRLVKVDLGDGEPCLWEEDDCYPGEPVFVASHEPDAEDDGVVLDARRGHSFLLVLDAGSFKELARAEVPHHIPFQVHGDYFGNKKPTRQES
jgi:beta,beta-carotene 9',10'-dioxygenase